ncbi:MAG: chemotaxis protein CheW [Thiolinea sp.]
MTTPYELLTGLALLREKKRLAESQSEKSLESWSALVVRVGDEICVMRQDDVDEILNLDKLTVVKGLAPWFLGVGYFRGQLLNVLDGQNLFNCGRSAKPNAAMARILVVRGEDEWFGLKVSELVGIRHVWSDNIDSFRAVRDQAWLGLVERWIRLEGELAPVINLKQLMLKLERLGRLDDISVDLEAGQPE